MFPVISVLGAPAAVESVAVTDEVANCVAMSRVITGRVAENMLSAGTVRLVGGSVSTIGGGTVIKAASPLFAQSNSSREAEAMLNLEEGSLRWNRCCLYISLGRCCLLLAVAAGITAIMPHAPCWRSIG